VTAVIDCDVHCAPTSFETLAPYLSDYWREYVSEAGLRITGMVTAYPRGARTTATDEARAHGTPVPATYEALRERVLDPLQPRHVILNCLTMFEAYRNPFYSAALASALNDWIRTEWLDRDERLRASLAVPLVDPVAAAREIDRLGPDPRVVQVLLPVRGDVPLGNHVYRPIYDAAARHDLVIGVHAWGQASHAPTRSGFTSTYLHDYVSNAQVAQSQVASLVSEGVFARFPGLRVALLECGFAWLPSLLWRFDKDWKGIWRETPWLKERPSAYVRRHVRATTQPAQLPEDPEEVRQVVDLVGAGWLLHASDYPHDHGPSGGALLDVLGEEEREALLQGNAARFYGLEGGSGGVSPDQKGDQGRSGGSGGGPQQKTVEV
jgi:uncharacterized protein